MSTSRKPNQKKLIRPGDIIELGTHRLACGDARDPKLVAKLLRDDTVSLIASDPPFGVSYTESKEGFSKVTVPKPIIGDNISSEDEYALFTESWLEAIKPYLGRKNACYIFNSEKMLFALREGMKRADINFAQLLIWIKNHAVIGRKDYLCSHELIAYGWHGAHIFRKAKDKSVLYYPKPNRSPLHPTMKPIGLMRRLILNSSKIHDAVYDPFGGAGSTLIACEQTKRKCLMIEIDPEYCATIISRFKRLTNASTTS